MSVASYGNPASYAVEGMLQEMDLGGQATEVQRLAFSEVELTALLWSS